MREGEKAGRKGGECRRRMRTAEREGRERASAVERRAGRNKRGEEREWNGWDGRGLVLERKEAILS